jgi:Holliday junction resolvase RusA-like endonuclease
MIKYSIPFTLPGCNNYINACRTHRRAGGAFKKKVERDICDALVSQKIVEIGSYPVKIMFVWKEKNLRRDVDNVAFDKKFVLDALVDVGAIEDDRRKFVSGFVDDFPAPDKKDIGVDIYILEE